MAGNENKYGTQHDLNRARFWSVDMDQNLTELQRQQLAKELNCNIALSQSPFYSDAYRLASDNTLRPHEGDQVVPSSQRRTFFAGHPREAKPLPPPPDPEDVMSDEAADSEVEFFTSDRRRLLPKSCPKAIRRGKNRDSGQVNHAYQESSWRAGGAGTGAAAFSWPSREDRPAGRDGGGFWAPARRGEDPQRVGSAVGDALSSRQPDPHRLRLPYPAADSPPLDGSASTRPPEKPLVPPRVPIPPKPPALSKTLSSGEEGKPPKIPPRVPLVPPCPPRTPSPKRLPIYINGVMPATQSFAANPNYVSKTLQRQQSERVPPAAQFSPCIVPIVKDGRKASATHYILLPPGRQPPPPPPHSDRRERLLSEPARMGTGGVWQNR